MKIFVVWKSSPGMGMLSRTPAEELALMGPVDGNEKGGGGGGGGRRKKKKKAEEKRKKHGPEPCHFAVGGLCLSRH